MQSSLIGNRGELAQEIGFPMVSPAGEAGEIQQGLRAELEALRQERAKLLDRQQHIMELIGTTDPEHLLHDLRNVLNERALLRALTEGQF